MCNKCKSKYYCWDCCALSEHYEKSPDPRFATETIERVLCCVHKKSRGWSNCVANDDGAFSRKDGQQCGMKQKKTNLRKAKARGKAKATIQSMSPRKENVRKKRRRTSEPADCDISSIASDDSRATWDKRPVSPEKKRHKLFICMERSVIDGVAYTVLNHWIEATEYTEKDFALAEQKIPMMVIIDAASEAIDEQRAQGGLDREEP